MTSAATSYLRPRLVAGHKRLSAWHTPPGLVRVRAGSIEFSVLTPCEIAKGFNLPRVVHHRGLANFHALRSWRARRPVDDEYDICSDERFSDARPRSDPLPMASLRPGPAVIQRANSLQASDTSHTSASSTSTSADASTNTSVSHSKSSPVSSIGESISSPPKPALSLPLPPARTVRPLPIPPSLSPPTSPGLTSTSTLRLSHQESHSTLGKSSQPNLAKPASGSSLSLTKSKNTPPRKLGRARPASDADPQPQPPPSAFNTRRMSDDGWVSVSIMPVLSERSPAGTCVYASDVIPDPEDTYDSISCVSYLLPPSFRI
ncbi:hypothetical protein FRC12_005999 [Ceratobasidium sp. 428]|nr:hypothetical protein FRC12_005999 [Ceratobasidium sp. 428]